MQLGSADYILKPVDYQDLDEAICRLAERVKLAKNVLINTDCSIRQVAGICGL